MEDQIVEGAPVEAAAEPEAPVEAPAEVQVEAVVGEEPAAPAAE